MPSIQELNRIKHDYTRPKGTKIIVRLGICGASVGARDVLDIFRKEVNRLGLKDVTIITTGCIGLCSLEPLVDVIKPGKPPATYTFVTPEKARGILFHHVIRGQVITEWLVR